MRLGYRHSKPENVAFAAGRLMLGRVRELFRTSFAFESTLASRSLAPLIAAATRSGYRFHLLYLWLESPTQASARVNRRVRAGGHAIPTDVVARRYGRNLDNFFRLYRSLAHAWCFYDNSAEFAPRVVASGGRRTADEGSRSRALVGVRSELR